MKGSIFGGLMIIAGRLIYRSDQALTIIPWKVLGSVENSLGRPIIQLTGMVLLSQQVAKI